MAREASVKENRLNFTIELLFKSVQVTVEKLEPSTIEYYTQGPIKRKELSKYSQQLSPCIIDQTDDQDHLARTGDANVAAKVFPKPPCPLGVLLILLLENSTSKALTFMELNDMLFQIFPYFRTVVCTTRILIERMSHIMCMEEYRRVFIKEKVEGSEIIYVRLNPSKRKEYKKIVQESLQNHKEEFKASMCKPHLLNKFLRGRARLHPKCNSLPNFKDLADKAHTSGNVGGKSLPEINGPSERTSIRNSEVSEKSTTGNNLLNDYPKVSERLNCETHGSDCSQSVQGCSESSDSVKPSISSSKVDTLKSVGDSVTDENSFSSETVCPNNKSQSQQVLSSDETSITMQPKSGILQKNSLENLEAAENSVSSVNINKEQMSGTIQKNSLKNLEAVEDSVSSVNISEGQMLGTVQKNSLDNLETVEDSVSSVNISKEQMSGTVQKNSLENLETVEDTVSNVNISVESVSGTAQKNSSANLEAVEDSVSSVNISEKRMSGTLQKNSSETLETIKDTVSNVDISEEWVSGTVQKNSIKNLEAVEDLVSSVNISEEQMLGTVQKNSLENLEAVEDSVSSVNISEKQMSGTVQKNSFKNLEAVEDSVSSVNLSEEWKSGTVQKNSLENLEAVEDSISSVNISEEQMSLAISQSEENIGNFVEMIKENESQGTKRKLIISSKVIKKSKISPSKVLQTNLQNGAMILEKERKYASQKKPNNSSENVVAVEDGNLPHKSCLNDFQKCNKKSVSLYSKQGSSGSKKFHNEDSLPVITGTLSVSVSDMTKNDKDNKMVHLEHRDVEIPVVNDVLLTTESDEEKKSTQQCEVAEVSEGSNSNFRENGLPVIVSVEDRAFHMWTPNEPSSQSEGGKQLQEFGRKVKQYKNNSGKEHSGICNISIIDKNYQVDSHDVIQGANTHLSPPINNSNKTTADGQVVQFVEYLPSEKKKGAINMTLTANLRPKKSICSESPTQTVCSTSASQNHQLTVNTHIPKVSCCIDAWQNVFPWMLYSESDQSFLCKTCEWGNVQFKSCVVFTLKDPRDVYSVAQQLRCHQETLSHKIISRKMDLVHNFFKLLYPVIKHHMFRSFDGIIEDVTLLSGGYFPGPHESPKKEYYTSYMIKHIAECVEVSLLKSLAKSPVFSIVAVQEKEFAILRWLNRKGESEEHFFSSQICCSGEVMPILTYLQKRQVDTTKLISYSHFPNSGDSTMSKAKTGPLPVRYPPLSECLKWLQKTDFLRDLFVQLENLVIVCKSCFENFAVFSAAFEIANVEKPYNFSCVVNEKIVEFYFSNFSELKKICLEIYNETKSNDALNFSKAELTYFKSVQDFVSLLPILHRLFTEKNGDYSVLGREIKEFRSLICAKRRAFKGLNSDESIAFSVLDLYLSHTIISLQSQEQGIRNIFTMKLRKVTTKDLQKILSRLTIEYQGGSIQLLQDLHELRVQLSKSRDCIIVKLLEDLTKEPELCQSFPHLFSLYQKITVLPFFDANREQYMFNLAVLDMFLNGKIRDRLISPISLILLEGPPVAEIDVDHLLDLWSKKWKLDYAKR